MASLRRLLTILFFLFSLTTVASAQMNIEDIRLDNEDGFTSVLGLAYTFDQGNKAQHELEGSAVFGYETPRHLVFLIGENDYAEVNDVKNSNDGKIHLRYNYKIVKHWNWEAFSQWEYDEFRLIESRELLGTGIRWEKFFTGNFAFACGLSYMYEIERFDEDIVGQADLFDHRMSSYVATRIAIHHYADLVLSGYYQPMLTKWGDWKAIGDGDLIFKLTKNVHFTVSLSMTYDSGPPTSVKELDLSIINGIRVHF